MTTQLIAKDCRAPHIWLLATLAATPCWSCDAADDAARRDAAGPAGDSAVQSDGGADEVCERDEDCALVSTCCDCMPQTAGSPPACEESCEVTRCEASGIDPTWLMCGHRSSGNRCQPSTTVSCSPPYADFDYDTDEGDTMAALCSEPPPECGEGLVAEYDAATNCWSGRCVPVAFCDQVTKCADCPADQMCVARIITGAGRVTLSCRPPVAGCNGALDCACAGDEACGGAAVCVEDFGDSENATVLRAAARGGLICREDDG